MRRSLLVAVPVSCLLAAVATLVGCRMCQDCYDCTGPVPGSPNYGAYYTTPRSGSVVRGAPVYSAQAGTYEGAPVYGPPVYGPPVVEGSGSTSTVIPGPGSYIAPPSGSTVIEGAPPVINGGVLPPGRQWVPRGSMTR